MSRWIENFENHAFQNSWKQLKAQAEKLIANDETVVTDVKEIARLKKVIEFLDELIVASDPELIPQNIWNQFNDQTNNCLAQVKQYLQNKNIGHITNANNHLDNLLTYLRPYVVSGKGAAQAAGKAFSAYSKAVNDHIKILENKVKSVLSQTEQNKSQTDTILNEITTSKKNIQQLENEFLSGSEDNPSLKQKMETLFSDSTGWHAKIKDFFQKLTSGNEQESAIILQIEDARKKAISDSKDAREGKDSIAELLKDIGKFYVTVFGEENESGEREGGLKQELELRENDLEEFKNKHQETYKALHEEIEGLLPGATSAGLATAYIELKTSFDKPIEHFSKLFYGALIGIFVAGLILITKNIGFWHIEFIDLTEPMHLLNNLIYKLPILLPLLWLAVFASKRRSEDRRLQQEYAHKEALAKSYQSFKQQIESLQSKDDALMKQLLERAIIAIAFNASTTLDGKHGDKAPILGAVEKMAEKLTEKGVLDSNPLAKK